MQVGCEWLEYDPREIVSHIATGEECQVKLMQMHEKVWVYHASASPLPAARQTKYLDRDRQAPTAAGDRVVP